MAGLFFVVFAAIVPMSVESNRVGAIHSDVWSSEKSVAGQCRFLLKPIGPGGKALLFFLL